VGVGNHLGTVGGAVVVAGCSQGALGAGSQIVGLHAVIRGGPGRSKEPDVFKAWENGDDGRVRHVGAARSPVCEIGAATSGLSTTRLHSHAGAGCCELSASVQISHLAAINRGRAYRRPRGSTAPDADASTEGRWKRHVVRRGVG
jgi:hypothetical protein